MLIGVLTVGSAVAGLGAAPAAVAQPAKPIELALPAPEGVHPVGRQVLDLLDRNRADPWVPTQRRELMVSVWYPAARSGGTPAPYVTPDESRLLLRNRGVQAPDDALTWVTTHARDGAPVWRSGHRLPLIVLSPGFSYPRATLTGLAEELASRGYVVAGIDHTYEASGVSFPDGRVAECVACHLDLDGKGDLVTAGRAKDVSFVLDRLLARRSAWSGGSVIDPTRIAMAGHSIGGDAALATMLADRRVDAGVNMDGTFHPALERPLRRPFLMLGAEASPPGTDTSWDETWNHLSGAKYWLTVTGTTHSSFTDLAVLADQFGIPIQPLPGARADKITRTYVTAFMDRHLRGHREPLLKGPSLRYPEVRFWGVVRPASAAPSTG